MSNVSIGLHSPHEIESISGAARAAYLFGAFSLVVGTNMIDLPHAIASWRSLIYSDYHFLDKIQLVVCRDVASYRVPPYTKTIGVERVDTAQSIMAFTHPENAYYIFGSEKEGLPKSIYSKCDDVVQIPVGFNLNIPVAVGVVLYDRLLKENDIRYPTIDTQIAAITKR